MNSEILINKYGREVRLITKGWGSPTFKAFILPHKATNGKVICEKPDTFLIITPAAHDIAALDNPRNYVFIINQKKYRILQAEKVMQLGVHVYSYGIIEQIKEKNND